MDAVRSHTTQVASKEEARHDRAAEVTAELDLGAVLDEVADLVEAHVEQEAARDFAYAVAMRYHPGDVALAHLTDRLLKHCLTLALGVTEIPDERLSAHGVAALRVWNQLRINGPADGALGNWSYCKHLAQAGRDMLRAIGDHRRAERPARFVGRTEPEPAPTDIT
ncbi:hypothetical protein [Streptomyces sp. NPDC056632]|uniref:hypothetical protein n=1 Tax=Streptomyces sp. NPDC056632 TaxID=3345884 RepID=UPI00369D7E52